MYIDLFLLHPVFRGCLPSLNKDVANNDVKRILAEGLAGDNAEHFASLFNTRNGRFLRKVIKDTGEKRERDETFCASLPEIVKFVDAFERVKRESQTGVK